MPYDVGQDPYIDPATGILRNRLGIASQAELDEIEAGITAAKIAVLLGEDAAGRDMSFDADLLLGVHRQLFDDLYGWAGKLRTVELTKGTTSFARAEHLAASLDGLMKQLAAERYLVALGHEAFIARLAHYYGELTVLHPFREGNGRSIRTFLALLADNAGWHIAWDKMSPQKNIDASIAAYHGDEKPFQDLLRPIVVPQ